MCCFSRPVAHVSATKIFARPLAGGAQHLVYEMSFAAAGDLAMILPLPVPPRPPEDAVRFIDLAGYPRFFEDLARAFPVRMAAPARSAGLLSAVVPARPKLKVHSVGLFEASFVPTLDDFDRLDPRFRLAPEVWDALPNYRDWGFAVFKLERARVGLLGRLLGREGAPRGVHPMAFTFPRRDPRTIYFPTVHVHDGEVRPTAEFDHTLYCQPDALVAETFGWTKSDAPLDERVDVDRARGIVDGARPGFQMELHGTYPNTDVELTPPECRDVASLRHVDRCFELRIRARSAYALAPDVRTARWRDNARHRLEPLRDGLRAGVAALAGERATEWDLCEYDPALPECGFDGRAIYDTTLLVEGGLARRLAPRPGPVRVLFRLSDERIEPQEVCLAFASVPDPARLDAIQAELAGVLRRVPI